MNIKSLLLGSAAALVAVTGARAADAPVTMVEPEPVEYVRVCDVYGTGFFYIPGTETCLKIGGYVRMRLQYNDRQYNGDIDDGSDFGIDEEGDDYTFTTRTRARLDFDAREETELGTLRAKIRLEATNRATTNNNAEYTAEEAFMQLGGFTVGFLDSLWTADDGGISDGLLTDTDFAAGDFQANRISYTAAFGGFSGTLSVEDDGSGDIIPDVLAKVSYKGGFGGAYVMGVYDEDSFESGDNPLFDTDTIEIGSLNLVGRGPDDSFGNYDVFTDELDGDEEDGGFVVKAGISLENLILADSILKIEGHYAFDPSIYATVGNVFTYSNGGVNNFGRSVGQDAFGNTVVTDNDSAFALPSEYQIGAGYQQTFGKIFAAVSGVYGETFDLEGEFSGFNDAGLVTDVDADVGSLEYYGFAGNLGYQITSNFSTLAEVSYVSIDNPVG